MSRGSPPSSKISTGRRGEDRAVLFLESIGFRIVERNHRSRLGEIDIVARDGEVLVFVEVRTRASARFGSALEAVGPRKRAQVAKVAAAYLTRHPAPRGGVRFDVIGITGETLSHIKDAFRLGEFAGRY